MEAFPEMNPTLVIPQSLPRFRRVRGLAAVE